MATKVYIWKNDARQVGHSSLEIGNVYLSFWPSDAAKGKKDIKFNQTHDSRFLENERADRLYMGTPDHVVTIWGLDKPKMLKMIRSIKNEKWNYNMKNCNCSSVVAQVLEEGSSCPPALGKTHYADAVKKCHGGTFLSPLIRLGIIDLWSPNALYQYALQLAQKAASKS